MMTRITTVAAFCLAIVVCSSAVAQTSSLGARKRKADEQGPPPAPNAERQEQKVHPAIARYSWTAIQQPKPRSFKVNDLVTIIIREQRRFEADADLKSKQSFDIKSQLTAIMNFMDGGAGATAFSRGSPNVDFNMETKTKNKGESTREDRLTARITAKIIDVKPNGNLVLEARGRVVHDDEESIITITGTCRKDDVTADNTVLSSQMADKNVVIDNSGAVRDASKRGWIPKLLDLVKPF